MTSPATKGIHDSALANELVALEVKDMFCAWQLRSLAMLL